MINPDSPWPDFYDRVALARRQCIHAPTLNERLMFWSDFVSSNPLSDAPDGVASFSEVP